MEKLLYILSLIATISVPIVTIWQFLKSKKLKVEQEENERLKITLNNNSGTISQNFYVNSSIEENIKRSEQLRQRIVKNKEKREKIEERSQFIAKYFPIGALIILAVIAFLKLTERWDSQEIPFNNLDKVVPSLFDAVEVLLMGMILFLFLLTIMLLIKNSSYSKNSLLTFIAVNIASIINLNVIKIYSINETLQISIEHYNTNSQSVEPLESLLSISHFIFSFGLVISILLTVQIAVYLLQSTLTNLDFHYKIKRSFKNKVIAYLLIPIIVFFYFQSFDIF